MLIVGLFSWWYGAGWLQLVHRVLGRIVSTLDFFSIGLLLKTLFSPYRQISVGQVQGPVGVKLRAWFDLQISRVIGAMVRTAVILFGLIATVVMIVAAMALIIIWPLLPVAPLFAIVAAIGAV